MRIIGAIETIMAIKYGNYKNYSDYKSYNKKNSTQQKKGTNRS